MQLPTLTAAVARSRDNLGKLRKSVHGVHPHDCTGVPGGIIGRCFFSDSAPIDGFNCSACCAFRTAVGWAGGEYAVECD